MIARDAGAEFAARFAVPWSLRRTADLLLRREVAWPEARIVSMTVPVDAAVARAWLPPGLVPDAPARAVVFVADYPRTSFGVAYREAGVLLCARHHRRPVLHCAWMVVDDDTAMILGRELLGFPKKLARIDVDVDADAGTARARVERAGVEILALDASAGMSAAPGSADAPPFASPIVNLWGPVLLSMVVPQRVLAGRAALGELRTRDTPSDPLATLVPPTTAAARVQIVDLGVPPIGWSLPQIRPVGLVAPWWLLSRYPSRTW